MRSFASDYRCAPHPNVVKAVTKACSKASDRSYGQDKITGEARELLRTHFQGEGSVFFVSNGTAANRLALQTILDHPFHSVICTEQAHINNAECGAIESLGHKLHTLRTQQGKINLAAIDPYMRQRLNSNLAYPQVLSISNATEVGTVYSYVELDAIGDYSRCNRLKLHLDGARLANAAAHLRCNLSSITLGIGADVLTLGGTKNGGIMGDAVIFRNPSSIHTADRLHKQQGQLCARMHLIAAQFIALFTDSLWFKNAEHANAMATLLAERCQNELNLPPVYPVQSNAVFVALPSDIIPNLLKETDFYVWDEDAGIVRWMCSWDTTEDDVDELINLVKRNMK